VCSDVGLFAFAAAISSLPVTVWTHFELFVLSGSQTTQTDVSMSDIRVGYWVWGCVFNFLGI